MEKDTIKIYSQIIDKYKLGKKKRIDKLIIIRKEKTLFKKLKIISC